MFTHKIILNGSRLKEQGISSLILRDLLNIIIEGSVRALRLRLEGRSTVAGKLPSWLDAIADFEVVISSPIQINIEAIPLSMAAPEKFGQTSLFSDVDPSRPALVYFEDSLEDALEGEADSDLYDNGLLDTFTGFSNLLAHGIDCIEITNGRPRDRGPLRIYPGNIKIIKELQRKTPSNRRIRIAGKVDTIRHSDRMFILILESGQALRGVADNTNADELAKFFGKTVVISGTAVFRPSGSILRIEADHIEPAKGDVSIWSVEPKPLDTDIDSRMLRKPQDEHSGMNAIFGQWPGDETDDEVLAALEAIS
jgi:hypothetical protein